MKKILLSLLFMMSVITMSAQKSVRHYAFIDAEKSIDSSVVAVYKQKTILPLLQIEKKYNNLEVSNSLIWNYYKKYWLAMIMYRKAEYYFYVENNYQRSRFETQLGIRYLQKIKKKDSDSYVLLAMLEIFQYKLLNPEQHTQQRKKIEDNISKAYALDEDNPRGYYVKAYYQNTLLTDETKYLKTNKIIKLGLKSYDFFYQNNESSYAPVWGDLELMEEQVKYNLNNEYDNQAQIDFLRMKKKFKDHFIVEKFIQTLGEEEDKKIFRQYSNL